MRLAHVMSIGRGATDQLLEALAETLMAEGTRVVGVVQTNTERPAPLLCDMDVRVLPDGPQYRISQTLGAGSKSCRLDPVALEQSVGEVESRLDDHAQLLLVNKFGKHEAEGRGFRTTIGKALELDIPVIVGLNDKNREAWLEYCDGESTELEGDADTLLDWARSALKPETAA